MIDGAPATRFTEWLKELIESGYGLTLDEKAIAPPVRSYRVSEEVLHAR
jgi:hypothetical protein